MIKDRIELIRGFVNKQQLLIDLSISEFGEFIDDLNFKKYLPENVVFQNQNWDIKPHGVGIRFECQKTGEIIDAHIGFLDMPNAFDAWRLEEYCASTGLSFEDKKSWKIVLGELHKTGDILASERPHLFTLKSLEVNDLE